METEKQIPPAGEMVYTDSIVTPLERVRDLVINHRPKFNLGDHVVYEDQTTNNSYLRGFFMSRIDTLPRPMLTIDRDGKEGVSYLYSFEKHDPIPEKDIMLIERIN